MVLLMYSASSDQELEPIPSTTVAATTGPVPSISTSDLMSSIFTAVSAPSSSAKPTTHAYEQSTSTYYSSSIVYGESVKTLTHSTSSPLNEIYSTTQESPSTNAITVGKTSTSTSTTKMSTASSADERKLSTSGANNASFSTTRTSLSGASTSINDTKDTSVQTSLLHSTAPETPTPTVVTAPGTSSIHDYATNISADVGNTSAASIELTDITTAFTKEVTTAFIRLNTLTVLWGPVSLGVLSNSSSTYRLPAPYDSVQILVPAGAWQGDSNRRSDTRQLAAAVLSLAAGAPVPGAGCGPAVWLGPQGAHPLLLPLTVALPCANLSSALLVDGTMVARPLGFEFNLEQSKWIPLRIAQGSPAYANGTLWASAPSLGLLAAFWVLSRDPAMSQSSQVNNSNGSFHAVASSNSTSSTSSGGIGPTIALIAGAAAGGASLAIAGFATWFILKRRRKRAEQRKEGDAKIDSRQDKIKGKTSSALVFIESDTGDESAHENAKSKFGHARDAQSKTRGAVKDKVGADPECALDNDIMPVTGDDASITIEEDPLSRPRQPKTSKPVAADSADILERKVQDAETNQNPGEQSRLRRQYSSDCSSATRGYQPSHGSDSEDRVIQISHSPHHSSTKKERRTSIVSQQNVSIPSPKSRRERSARTRTGSIGDAQTGLDGGESALASRGETSRRRRRSNICDPSVGSERGLRPTSSRAGAVLVPSDSGVEDGLPLSPSSRTQTIPRLRDQRRPAGAAAADSKPQSPMSKAAAMAAAAAYADGLAAASGWPLAAVRSSGPNPKSGERSEGGYRDGRGFTLAGIKSASDPATFGARTIDNSSSSPLSRREEQASLHPGDSTSRSGASGVPSGPTGSWPSPLRRRDGSVHDGSVHSKESRSPTEILAAAVAERERRARLYEQERVEQTSIFPRREQTSIFPRKEDRGWPAPQRNLPNEPLSATGPAGPGPGVGVDPVRSLGDPGARGGVSGRVDVSMRAPPPIAQQSLHAPPAAQVRPTVQPALAGGGRRNVREETLSSPSRSGGSECRSAGKASNGGPQAGGPASAGSYSLGDSADYHSEPDGSPFLAYSDRGNGGFSSGSGRHGVPPSLGRARGPEDSRRHQQDRSRA
jgi:hypothetical protein